MPTAPSVPRTFCCKRCSPPNNPVGVIPVSHWDEGTSSPQGSTVPFPQAQRENPAPGPQRGYGSAESSRPRAPGRLKLQRACGVHPREAISPDSCSPRHSGPMTSRGFAGRGARSSAAHSWLLSRTSGTPRDEHLPHRPLAVLCALLQLLRPRRPLSGPRPAPPAPPRATRGEVEPQREKPAPA